GKGETQGHFFSLVSHFSLAPAAEPSNNAENQDSLASSTNVADAGPVEHRGATTGEKAMRFQIGAMSVGDILDRGLKLLMSRLGTFYTINLIFLGPLILVQLILPLANLPIIMALSALILLLLALILQPVASAAQLYVVAQDFVDHRVGVGEA